MQRLSSRKLKKPAKNASGEPQLVVPSFLRVMEAEQTLQDNYAYEDGNIVRYAAGGVRLIEDSSETEVENENSIPQESSIAANIAIQNQRRATGTLNE